MKEKLVSVIIPTHNRSSVVATAIHSVINQSYRNIEIVVVDDGSDDEYVTELEKLKNDVQLKLVKLAERSNAANARNIGASSSNGDYIAFLDSDDEFLQEHLKSKIELLESRNYDGVLGSFVVNSNGKKTDYILNSKRDIKDIYNYFSYKGVDFRTSTFVVKRSSFTKVLFDKELEKHQDWDFALRFGEKFKWGIDEKPNVQMNVEHMDRMSARLNHQASKYFLQKHQQKLDKSRRQSILTLLALKTAIVEGKNTHYKNYRDLLKSNYKDLGFKYRMFFSMIEAPFLGDFFLNIVRLTKGY